MEDEEGHDGSQYREPDTIDPSELRVGLESLVLFAGDMNMRQQGFNLSVMDGFAMRLESQLLKKLIGEEPYIEQAMFLNALSQMWIFAAYELMRTWRQRARESVEWANGGKLQAKLDELRKDMGFTHFGRELRARQIEQVIAEPTLIARLLSDRRRIHMLFARMEAIRVSIAKHEVRGRRQSVAFMPNYGRINMTCGSLDYELSGGSVSLGTISRRDIADDIRAIPQLTEPTDEQIASFDAFMRGPSPEELAAIFEGAPAEDF